MTKENQSNDYKQLLDTMINKLSEEIAVTTKPHSTLSGLDSLDEYIHALNAFYYRSFKEHYFPQFINIMDNEISALFNLRHKEDQLERDIMTSMQRYVKLYNQVKTIRNLLFKSRHEINKKLLDATRYEDKSNADFLLAIKQLKDNLQLFRLYTLDLLQLTEDEALMKSLKQFPDYEALVQLVLKMDFNNQNDLKDVNSLLGHFAFMNKLLQDNSREFWENSENGTELKERLRLSMDEYTKKASPAINSYYIKHIKNRLSVYIQLFNPVFKSSTKNNFSFARDLKEWLDALAVTLERCIYYQTNKNVMVPHLATVISLPAGYARLLNSWVTDCLEETSKLYEDFAQASEPDFNYFYDQSTLLINKHTDKLTASDWRTFSSDSSPLPFWQRRVVLELSSLAYQMAFFREKHLYARHVIDQYLEVVNLLDSYLNLLATIRSDLERMIAPRNISRAWKDIYIKIDRVPLETGKLFPFEYLALLPENTVRRQSSEVPFNTVLYEEGDLFTIKVESQTAVEIPALVLAG